MFDTAACNPAQRPANQERTRCKIAGNDALQQFFARELSLARRARDQDRRADDRRSIPACAGGSNAPANARRTAHALCEEGRHLMRRVACQECATVSPLLDDARAET
jgi:hypothetical protein